MKNRIRELRKEKGLTLKELSQRLKENGTPISASSLIKYERGERNPKLETWIKLADYFDVSVSYLQGISEIKKPIKLNSFEEWFKHLGINRNDFVHDAMNEKDRQIIEKETPALFNEINIYEFDLLKKAIFNKTQGESLKEYKKIADSINDSAKMSDVTEFTRNAFMIALRGLNGDKKAKECYKEISEIINHYFGYDEFDF